LDRCETARASMWRGRLTVLVPKLLDLSLMNLSKCRKGTPGRLAVLIGTAKQGRGT
jgi:hypothetical protein